MSFRKLKYLGNVSALQILLEIKRKEKVTKEATKIKDEREELKKSF